MPHDYKRVLAERAAEAAEVAANGGSPSRDGVRRRQAGLRDADSLQAEQEPA